MIAWRAGMVGAVALSVLTYNSDARVSVVEASMEPNLA
jgi:hypothetical protein